MCTNALNASLPLRSLLANPRMGNMMVTTPSESAKTQGLPQPLPSPWEPPADRSRLRAPGEGRLLSVRLIAEFLISWLSLKQ